MSNNSFVFTSSFGVLVSLLIFTSYSGLTSPSILYTSEAVGSFFTLAAYLKIYHTNKAVTITQRTRRSVNPSIQLIPAALEAMMVEKGLEKAGRQPMEVPPK